MPTVARRTFRSSPHRNALDTWGAITKLLTANSVDARHALDDVAGIASSVIADKANETSPILASCEGPQTRIYCLFDDDAIDGSDANEDVLGYDPLKGDWSISLPCEAEDLAWVQSALKQKGDRITARDKAETNKQEASKSTQGVALELDVEGFMDP